MVPALFVLLVLVMPLQAEPSTTQDLPVHTSGVGDDPDLLREVARIAGRVEILRAERFVRPPFAVRVPEELRAAAAEIRSFAVVSRARLAARGRAWSDIGLGRPESPRNVLLALASDLDGIAFDPGGNRLLISPDRLPMGDFEPNDSEDDPATVLLLTGMRRDAPLVAHMLTHVRQRERAGRDGPETTTDRLLASAAWAEGEANLVAVRYLFAGLQVTEDVMEFVKDPGEVLDGALLPPGLDGMAAGERELIAFVYQKGYERSSERHRSGGWAALDEAMATRRTTRDLIHPERRPLPDVAFAPSARPPREGLVLADEDSLGELGIVVLVSVLTGKDSLGLVAGEGWAGDRLDRWEAAGSEGGVTEWTTRWTTPAIAADFDYAYGRALETRFPGEAFSSVGDGVRTMIAGGRLFRVERRESSVRVVIQSSAGPS
jgi:hypothetical protein